jgi:hypothetical protein
LRKVALLVVFATCAFLASPALGADPPQPTPERLWNAYPLEPTPEVVPLSFPQETAAESESGSTSAALLVALLTVTGLVLLTFAAYAVRRAGTSAPVVDEPPREPPAVLSEHARRVAEYTQTPVAAVQRVAVAQPLPKAAATGWETCTIEWWRGYVKSDFYAVAAQPDGRPRIAARSSLFRWRGEEPPPRSNATEASLRMLVERLEYDGWEPVGRGDRWYELSFQRPR